MDNNIENEVVFDKLINMNTPKKIANKLYILYSMDLGVEYKRNIMIINLDTAKIELDTSIDDASHITPIDDNRILIEKGIINTEYSLVIYNL